MTPLFACDKAKQIFPSCLRLLIKRDTCFPFRLYPTSCSLSHKWLAKIRTLCPPKTSQTRRQTFPVQLMIDCSPYCKPIPTVNLTCNMSAPPYKSLRQNLPSHPGGFHYCNSLNEITSVTVLFVLSYMVRKGFPVCHGGNGCWCHLPSLSFSLSRQVKEIKAKSFPLTVPSDKTVRDTDIFCLHNFYFWVMDSRQLYVFREIYIVKFVNRTFTKL